MIQCNCTTVPSRTTQVYAIALPPRSMTLISCGADCITSARDAELQFDSVNIIRPWMTGRRVLRGWFMDPVMKFLGSGLDRGGFSSTNGFNSQILFKV